MKEIFKRKIFVSLLLIFIANICLAQDAIVIGLNGVELNEWSISEEEDLTIEDQNYQYIFQNPIGSSEPYIQYFKPLNPLIKTELIYNETDPFVYGDNWEVVIDYSLSYRMIDDLETTFVVNDELTINFNVDGSYQYLDMNIIEGAIWGELSILDISTPVNFEFSNDIFLNLKYESDQLVKLSNDAPTLNYDIGGNDPESDCRIDLDEQIEIPYAEYNSVDLDWELVDGANSYDLEWLFIDIGNSESSTNFEGDFYNATRINLESNHYTIQLGYPRGYLLFRVRAVGVNIESNEKELGPWSDHQNGHVQTNLIGWDNKILFCGLDPKKSWDYSIAFAQNGMNTETISFFDGSQRARMGISHAYGDDRAIYGYSLYDYQGRETMSFLPSSENFSGLAYDESVLPLVLEDGEIIKFDRKIFDVDETKDGNNDHEELFLDHSIQLAGATKYYSPSNQFSNDLYRDHIPDAQGYAYSRNQISNDGTGQAIKSSGIGDVMGPGSDIVSTMMLGSPGSQEELDRLFGNEVGSVSHYQKRYFTDPNGQVYVEYLDLKGRVIASALSGEKPNQMDWLTENGQSPEEVDLEGDVLESNNLDSEGLGYFASKTIVIAEPQTINFNYEFDGADFSMECHSQDFDDVLESYECSYFIFIEIFDSEGNIVFTYPSIDPEFGIHSISSDDVFESESITLDPGAYTITRRAKLDLEVMEQAKDQFIDDYFDPLGSPCLEIEPFSCNEESFCQDYCLSTYTYKENGTVYVLGYVDDGDGDVNNDELEVVGEKVGPSINYYDGSSLNYTLHPPIKDCIAHCNGEVSDNFILDECSMKYEQMITSLMPGGAFYENIAAKFIYDDILLEWVENPVYETGIDQNSRIGWFKSWALTPNSNIVNPMYCEDSSPTFNELLAEKGIDSPPPTWYGFIDYNWTYEEARLIAEEILLPFHPEYCAYYYHCVVLETQLSEQEYIPDNAFKAFNTEMQLMSMTQEELGLGDGEYLIPHLGGLDYNIGNLTDVSSGQTGDNQNYISPEALNQLHSWSEPLDPYFEFTADYGYDAYYNAQDEFGINHSHTYGQGNDFIKERLFKFLKPFPDNHPCNDGVEDDIYYSIWYVLDDPDGFFNGQLDQPYPNIDDPLIDPNIAEAIMNIQKKIHDPENPITKFQFFHSVYTFWKKYVDYMVYSNNGVFESYNSHCDQCGNFIDESDPEGENNPTAYMKAGGEYKVNGHIFSWRYGVQDGFPLLFPNDPIFHLMTLHHDNDYCDLYADIFDLVESEMTTSCQSQVDAWITGVNELCEYELIQNLEDDLNDFCISSGGSGIWNMELDPFEFDHNGLTEYAVSFENIIEIHLGSECVPDVYTSTGQIDIGGSESDETCGCEQMVNLYNDFIEDGGEVQTWVESGIVPEDFNIGTAISYIEMNGCASYLDPDGNNGEIPDIFLCELGFQLEDENLCDVLLADYQEQNAQYILEERLALEAKFENEWIEAALNGIENESFTFNYSMKEYYYTLYYYDQAGSLVKTVPPSGVQPISTELLETVSLHRENPSEENPFIYPQHSLSTNNAYNSIGEIKRNTTPDGGSAYVFYDKLGRVLITQSASQKIDLSDESQIVYSYLKYDELDRQVEAGQLYSLTSYDEELGCLSSLNDYHDWIDDGERKEVTKVFFDNSPFETPDLEWPEDIHYHRNVVASTITIENYNPLYPNDFDFAQHFSYDIQGNVKSFIQENNRLNFHDYDVFRTDYSYDFVNGNLISTVYQEGKVDQHFTNYFYDSYNRLIEVESSSNGKVWDTDQKYFYYETGEIARVETGERQVQAQDYAYTLDGSLKFINGNSLDRQREIGHDGELGASNLNAHFGNDAIGFSLTSFKGDYTPIQSEDDLLNPLVVEGIGDIGFPGIDEMYNGNIARMIVALPDGEGGRFNIQDNHYHYDQLNRLKEYAVYNNLNGNQDEIHNTNSLNGALLTQDYLTSFNYDLNGNIVDLHRNAHDNGVLMDDMSYSYRPGTNQLLSIDDLAGNVLEVDFTGHGPFNGYDESEYEQGLYNYKFDHSGNLISDLGECISEIKWTASGKVQKIIREVGNEDCLGDDGSYPPDLEYFYDPSDQRIAKIVKPRLEDGSLTNEMQWVTTYYSRDYSGMPMAHYEQSISPFSNTLDCNWEGGTQIQSLDLIETNLYGAARIGILSERKEILQAGFNSEGVTFDEDGFIQFNVSPSICQPILDESISSSLGIKTFELSNHLGNVLVTISDRKERNPIFYDDFNNQDVLTNWDLVNNATFIGNGFGGQLHIPTNAVFGTGLTRNYPVDQGQEYTFNTFAYFDPVGSPELIVEYDGNVIGSTFIISGLNQVSFVINGSSDDVTISIVNGGMIAEQCVLTLAFAEFKSMHGATTLISSVSDYYPYGMEMPGRIFTDRAYRYSFNGVEKEDEISLGSYSTTFRLYDARIGKWTSIDPLAAKYPHQSPYCSFNNNPIYFSDPSGLEGGPWNCEDCPTEYVKEADHHLLNLGGGTSMLLYYHEGHSGDYEAGWYESHDYYEMIMNIGYGYADWAYHSEGHVSLIDLINGGGINVLQRDPFLPMNEMEFVLAMRNAFGLGIDANEKFLGMFGGIFHHGMEVSNLRRWEAGGNTPGNIQMVDNPAEDVILFLATGGTISIFKAASKRFASLVAKESVTVFRSSFSRNMLNFAEEAPALALTNAQLVSKAAIKAHHGVPFTTNAAVTGTLKHTYASKLLVRYQRRFGQRGLNTAAFKKGEHGRAFLDVLDETNRIIYDFKFGVTPIMKSAQFTKYSDYWRYPINLVDRFGRITLRN